MSVKSKSMARARESVAIKAREAGVAPATAMQRNAEGDRRSRS